MDTLTQKQRHNNMAAIRSRNTKPELMVRRWLWSRGFRYRLNSPRLPGHPDLVLRKYRTCIFVNGCFWHGHKTEVVEGTFVSADNDSLPLLKDSDCFRLPKTNRPFWTRKILRNMARDEQEQRQLAKMGWHCITIWECELKPQKRERTLTALEYTLNHIYLQDHTVGYPPIDEEQDYDVAAESGTP